MSEPDTRVVEQTLRISARPETVWRYWTDPQRMCEWWGSAAELDPRPGGTCRVEMGSGPVMRGQYLELVPHERIVFSFGWDPTARAPNLAPGSTRVEITLTDDGGDTIMTLRHSGIPVAHAEEHRAGWAHFLPRLAAAASRTVELRSTEEPRS
ncbi:MAG: SRPBCC family protein [Acidimicrobiales bacterium]